MLKNYTTTSLRNLGRNRSYAIINVMGLSLGMTGAIFIFIFLQHHLSTDRHHPNFGRLYRVVLDLHWDEGSESNSDASVALANSFSNDYPMVEKVGFSQKIPVATLSSQNGSDVKRFIEKDLVAYVNQGFMELFARNLLAGNLENIMNEPNVAVITEKIALKYYGSTDVVGKVLRFDNAINLRIAGILKDNFHPSDLEFEVYLSPKTLKSVDPAFEFENFGWLSSRNTIYLRLPEAVTPQMVNEEIKRNSERYYATAAKNYHHHLQPLAELHFDEKYGGKIKRSIIQILAIVGVLLVVIAAINFVNLATAQALKRSKEIGVRKALGGTKAQLFSQFMTETAMLTLGAGALSMGLALALLPFLNQWMHTDIFSLRSIFQWQVVLFASIAMILVTLLAGFYPSVIISGYNPVLALKGKLRSRQGGGMGLRRSLITFQLIVAQMLVVGTAILLFQMHYLKNSDLGFDQSSLVTIQLPNNDSLQNVKTALRNSLLQLPDVKEATYQYAAPSSTMGHGGSVKFDNRADWEKFVIRERYGDENYLKTYQMRLLAGRSYSDRKGVNEFVINEELMRKLGFTNPEKILGKMLHTGMDDRKGAIVGVVKSFHLKSLEAAIEPCAIFANPDRYKEIAVKVNTRNWSKSLQSLQFVWQKAYPDEVFSYQLVEEQIAHFYEKEEQLTSLITSFAFIAIMICCLGLFGMVSFMVVDRTREIGIRKVLGAGVESILVLFGKEFVILTIIAFIVAIPASRYLMESWLNGFVYRVDLKLWLFVMSGLLILVITLSTIGYRVVQAALMNPVKSLGGD